MQGSKVVSTELSKKKVPHCAIFFIFHPMEGVNKNFGKTALIKICTIQIRTKQGHPVCCIRMMDYHKSPETIYFFD